MNRLIIPLVIIILCSCTTQRKVIKYVDKHPEIIPEFFDTTTQVTVVHDTVEIRIIDSLYLPGDTVYEDTIIYKDTIIEESGLLNASISAESKYAKATSTIEDGVLSIELVQKENVPIFFDTIFSYITNDTTKVDFIEPEPVKVLPKSYYFFKYGFFILLGLYLILIVLLIRALRKGR